MMSKSRQDHIKKRGSRQSRHAKKAKDALTLPVSLVSSNFGIEDNFAHLVRAGACYGANQVCSIGTIPEYQKLKTLSGGANHWMDIGQYKSPLDFLSKTRNDIVIAIELTDDAVPLLDYKFDFSKHTHIVVGNETTGVPGDIIARADATLYIPMVGIGVCLNTAQAANVAMNEYVSQALRHGIKSIAQEYKRPK